MGAGSGEKRNNCVEKIENHTLNQQRRVFYLRKSGRHLSQHETFRKFGAYISGKYARSRIHPL
jgi:hypothetical protein